LSSSRCLSRSRECIVVDNDKVKSGSSELWKFNLLPTFSIPDGYSVLKRAMGGNLIYPHIHDGCGAHDENSADESLLMSNRCEVDGYLGLTSSRLHQQRATPAIAQQLLQCC